MSRKHRLAFVFGGGADGISLAAARRLGALITALVFGWLER